MFTSVLFPPRSHSVVSPGDTVHVIGEFDANGKCDVNSEKNFIIVHPDILVSGTRVHFIQLTYFSLCAYKY